MAEKKRRNGKSVVEVDSTERVLKQIFEVRCRCRLSRSGASLRHASC